VRPAAKPTAPPPAATPAAPPDAPDTGALQGRVHRILPDRGYGFIRCSTDGVQRGVDYFFHTSSLLDCQIDELEEGSLVRFTPRQTAKGGRAEAITRVTP